MDHTETKALAVEAIAEFRAAAESDPASYAGGHDGRADDADAANRLMDMVGRPDEAVNPHYACQGSLAAVLAVIALTRPEAYAELLGPVAEAYRGSVSPGTVSGLVTMGNFLSSIGDDHDWSVDMSGATPVIRYQGHLPSFVPTLSPLTLLDVLEPMLDAPAPVPAP